MIFIYAECKRNSIEAGRKYFERFPDRQQPNRTYFSKLEKTLREFGAFNKQVNKKCYVSRVDTNVERVLGFVSFKKNINADVSLREIEQNVGVSKTSTRRILRKNKYRPYKIKTLHHLRDEDFIRRRWFCNWLLRKYRTNKSISNNILWSDESRFSNNGQFNRNCHYRWSLENDNVHTIGNFQERFGINVWMGVLDNKIIGPYFFEQSLNGARYHDFLQHTLQELLDDLPLTDRMKFKYYQHDGAPAHTSLICVQYLNTSYRTNWIGCNGPIRWPPRSPDLTPLDFFIWGYIKNIVYRNPPENLDELKHKITRAAESITCRMLRNCNKSIIKRARLCLHKNGGHFEHIL